MRQTFWIEVLDQVEHEDPVELPIFVLEPARIHCDESAALSYLFGIRAERLARDVKGAVRIVDAYRLGAGHRGTKHDLAPSRANVETLLAGADSCQADCSRQTRRKSSAVCGVPVLVALHMAVVLARVELRTDLAIFQVGLSIHDRKLGLRARRPGL